MSYLTHADLGGQPGHGPVVPEARRRAVPRRLGAARTGA